MNHFGYHKRREVNSKKEEGCGTMQMQYPYRKKEWNAIYADAEEKTT
jgi:hypothetical protein